MSDQQVEELTLRVGELEISVKRRAPAGSGSLEPDSVSGSLAGLRAAAASAAASGDRLDRSPSSPCSWSVVGGGAAPWSREWKRALLAAFSATEILAVDLQPIEHLQRHLSSQSSDWTPLARLGRALRAGLVARNKLDGEGTFERSPDLGLANKVYIVLRGAPGEDPCICYSARVYYQAVRAPGSTQLHPRSVSHAFPSRVEAEAYALGAQELWPLERH